MARKNKRNTNKSATGIIIDIIIISIFLGIIILGIAMAYWGFTHDHETSYHMVVAGGMLIFIGLLFLSAGHASDNITSLFAGGMLICMGLLHPVTLILAVCGVYLIINNILVMTGNKKIADKMDAKVNVFLSKIFSHTHKKSPQEMTQKERNKELGLKRVNDFSKSKSQKPNSAPPESSPSETTFSEPISTVTVASGISETILTSPSDATSAEPSAEPHSQNMFSYFIMGFMLLVGGLLSLLPNIAAIAMGSSLAGQLPFLFFAGAFLSLGLFFIIKAIKRR